MKIVDIADMPGQHPIAKSRGERSVSEGQVYFDWLPNAWGGFNKVVCQDHGAMLAVNESCSIWRCIACGAGAYVPAND